MKKVDFLFVYENKNRELENICLLAHELKRRGYTVHMIETWHAIYHYQKPVDAKVVITSALYNDETFDFMASHVYQMRKVVNLQWEQVFSKERENSLDCAQSIKGKAKQAVHISWGENNKRRLTELYDVDCSHVVVTGHMALDFLRPELSGYYWSKEEMIEKYPILRGKKIYLFISSFGVVAVPKEYLQTELFKTTFKDPLFLQKNQQQSQKKILEWIRMELKEHPDVAFVYRPHPSEINSDEVKKMANEMENFFVIEEESVQQWILVSDRIFTQTSTSIVQIYAAKKKCTVVRPYPLPDVFDMSIYDGCNAVTTLEEFRKCFTTEADEFPIKEEKIREYYSIDDKELSYKKICDICEKVYYDNSFMIEKYPTTTPLHGIKFIRRKIKNYLYIVLGNMFRISIFSELLGSCNEKLKKIGEEALHTIIIEKKNYSTPNEIKKIEKRIKNCLD